MNELQPSEGKGTRRMTAAEIGVSEYPTFEKVMDSSTDTNNEFSLEGDIDLYKEVLGFWKNQQFPLIVYRYVALKEGENHVTHHS